ncbi:serine/threonine-protein kinase [Pseudomonas sp. UBA2684]|uniref:serine/threonine-protein kinase n=1 Tax=Pseudomonas sp. UBA2684 TaxID=1947311 RepID=UPI000E9AD480|nr:serine/threonine-protein kinase [Pseudomonas sp. UBA2684]HBX56122.1 serine/threonine protein kinase [Pseudomonas sp.]|tara:strand:+ start:48926 stop:50458 length:1533 start_codon:yes stop_codon:yes gene_type:complete
MNEGLIEIPGYSVHGRLGKGGMAEVYLATQQSLHRKVAVKVLLSADDEAFSQRFIKEGHIVASLHHPSIITIHDIDRLADGRYYLAMEFVPGGDLAQYKGEVFEVQRALRLVRQIASGLAVVHDKGLVHRDIKPANILFRDDATAVITDFGVAKEVTLDHDLTQFGIAVGSPAYSSPEQAQCQPLDARSDIYSLGVILLEMLTGTNPYRGANYTQTVMNHVQMDLPVLPTHLSGYQWLLERMLAKNPDERFADCRVLLASLDELHEQDSDSTRIAPALVLGLARPRAPAGIRRPVLLWALLGVLLLAGAGGAGYYGYQQMQIADYLAQAEQRLGEGKLLEPPQDNADFFFRQALLLDQHNVQALDGLNRVLQARINGYLQLAEQRIGEERLWLPEDDSAVFYFRQVLAWEPDNLLALAGMNRVAQRFIELSEQAYTRREYSLALEYIKQGLEVEPVNEILLKRYDDHERRVRVAQAPRAPAGTRSTGNAAAREPGAQNPIKRLWNNIFND